jgi:hypothetical protein
MRLPLSWYFACKYSYITSSFARWMAGGEPHEHPFMIKHDDTLYIFTAFPSIQISFNKNKDTGKKTVDLCANSRNFTRMPHFHLDANCFKRLIESSLTDMEEAVCV